MSILIKLFFVFFKIGAFSFGGGYAMLPFIQREIVDINKWISKSDFVDIIGISQMTPGPIAINAATFAGYKVKGVIGSIVATIGISITSFILVSIIQGAMSKFKESPIIKAALLGMKPAIIALILNSFVSLAKDAYVNYQAIIITLITGAMLISKKVHPILTIVIAGLLGLLFY